MPMRLLILSCSQRKRRCNSTVEALQLYDGVFFRVLKKAVDRPEILNDLEVLILSAKYGLLFPTSSVRYYDERMTRKRADELLPVVSKQLADFVATSSYDDVFVNLGKDYLPLVAGTPEFSTAVFAAGGSGQRCQQLKQWLYLPLAS